MQSEFGQLVICCVSNRIIRIIWMLELSELAEGAGSEIFSEDWTMKQG